MLTLGNAVIHRIVDLDPFALPLGFLFPGAKLEMLRGEEAMLAPHHLDFGTGNILLGVHSYLLQVGGRNILIDTCIGEHKQRPRRADWHQRANTPFIAGLSKHGLTPDNIDVVLCTHLHADHAGWNTKLVSGRWVPTFANARYLMGRSEALHWAQLEQDEPGKHNHGIYGDSVLPIIEAGLADYVDDGFELAPGLTIRSLPGHSPGQVGLCLCCPTGEKAFFCGDAVHSPVQVIRPDWTSAFCADKPQAIRTRTDLLEEAADRGTILLPAHLRHAGGMRIRRLADGRFRPDFL
jgi:glyoxylase-like metal-dependent hydrolase (beta-lactamase superfamily II)